MKLNLIICTGKYELGEKQVRDNIYPIQRTPSKLKKKFYRNTITLKPNFCRVHICHYIHELVACNQIAELLKRRIAHEFQREVKNLKIIYTNYQHSFNLNYSPVDIQKKFLPKLKEELGITLVYTTEEAHAVSAPVRIQNLIESETYPYITLTVKVSKASLKIQFTKNKLKSECSLIATGFNSQVQKLVEFLKNIERESKND